MRFAEAVISDPEMLNSLIDKFNEGRDYLIRTLDEKGYPHVGEAGNFLFIKPKSDAPTIVKRMKEEKKILIKSYPNVGMFGTCLRVSIGEKKIMQQFLDALVELDS
jgi:histidinol-phosphate aminotransferase